jgi:hypothetical protein
VFTDGGEEVECTTFEIWAKVKDAVESLELNKYAVSVWVVDRFADPNDVMRQFETEVLNQSWTEDQAELVLGTVHSAKGGEWDNVVVLADLGIEPLLAFQEKKNVNGGYAAYSERSNSQSSAQSGQGAQYEFRTKVSPSEAREREAGWGFDDDI